MGVENIHWDTLNYQRTILCYLQRGEEVLLIHKKTGQGKGKILGPGGKVELGETFRQACVREVQEEVGLILREEDLTERGDLYFYEEGVYTIWNKVFVATQWTGEPYETPEADPFWQSIWDLPFDKMWGDDLYWMLPLMRGSYLQGCFEAFEEKVISFHMELASSPLKSLHLRSSLKAQ